MRATLPPLGHPDFRFPGSRNIYWTRLKEGSGARALVDGACEGLAGGWREHLLGPGSVGAGLNVEIGCNGGHVLLEWAKRKPADAFVGIDWKHKQIFLAAEKAAKRGIPNAAFLRSTAERLPYIFAPAEIDTLSVFFPDPWPKKKQLKKRFFTAAWLQAIAPFVKAGGKLTVKTDHAGYFEWMEEAAAGATAHWAVRARSANLHAGHPDPRSLEIPEVTLFERVFIKDGLPIHLLALERL